MKATNLLRRQHREAERLFDEVMYSDDDRERLMRELALELAVHTALEERFVYPVLREALPGAYFMSLEEHAMAKVALERFVHSSPDDEGFEAKAALLKRLVVEHVDEEENDIFPELEDLLSPEDLKALGRQLEEASTQLRSAGLEPLLVENRRSAEAAVRNEDASAAPS